MDRWAGRVALVTGASSGIGWGVALRLAGYGMKVVTCARNFDKLRELEEIVKQSGSSGQIVPIKCDVTKEEEIIHAFDKIRETCKRIDVCINNAGVCNAASLLEGSTDEWKQMLDINILALCICTRESIKLMTDLNINDGQIINISSMSGHRLVDNFMYTATKQAVRALTEGLRQELRQKNSYIRVASISPANVDTNMTRHGSVPFKQLDVSDIEDAVIYILSAPPHAQVHDVLIRSIEQTT